MVFIVSGISYTYPGTSTGIENVSFQVPSSGIIGISGASGSGKSTLLACLAGILTPQSGAIQLAEEVLFDSTNVKSNQAKKQKGSLIEVIFQRSSLFEELSIWQNVALSLGPSLNQNKDHALRLLAEVGLKEYANRLPREISLGQRQRSAVVASLARSPRILLADEPTGSLDATNRDLVLSLFKVAANSGCLVLISSHDPEVHQATEQVIQLESRNSQ